MAAVITSASLEGDGRHLGNESSQRRHGEQQRVFVRLNPAVMFETAQGTRCIGEVKHFAGNNKNQRAAVAFFNLVFTPNFFEGLGNTFSLKRGKSFH